ncbi:unnamed protein product [Prorocentrum cordatum]|uniref:Endonuclease n=1 Tax=Prorocentrum cordatum TaxID=2364126 RepID=A0ABN9UWL5_9DINO|nr:unnamed protein product [Polarella glacialis]
MPQSPPPAAPACSRPTRRLPACVAPALLALAALAALLACAARGGASGPPAEPAGGQEFLVARKRSWSGVAMDSVGVFSGLRILQDFQRAAFWERQCPIHVLAHGTDSDVEVYSAAYNECTGVSDVVYYKVFAGRFVKGGGRGGGWSNDEELVNLMSDLGKKPNEYATVVDYQGCGLFGLDRGHQAPVASFNSDEEAASMTNTPTNLSPQNGYLNQQTWKFLEMEMRSKSEDADDDDVEEPTSFELITGPLYELPDAFFTNERGAELWEELLWSGGDVNLNGQPWCDLDEEDDGFRSTPLPKAGGKAREEKVTCHTGRTKMDKPSDNPNKLSIHYQRKKKMFPLRIPLGYYKLAVLSDESSYGRHMCPYVMDQTGQCMLVSLDVLLKLAHLDLDDSDLASLGGLEIQPEKSNKMYSAKVDPKFCFREGGTIDKRKLCGDASHLNNIRVPTMDSYWQEREAAA